MNIPQRLKALEMLVADVLSLDLLQRAQLYGTIKVILDEIDAYVEEHESENLGKGNAGLYIAEMHYPLETICGLDDNGHNLVQNLVWFRTGIDKLRSIHCFDISE